MFAFEWLCRVDEKKCFYIDWGAGRGRQRNQRRAREEKHTLNWELGHP